MPYRRLPNSMPAVIRTLTKARDEYKLVTTPALRAITAAQFALLDDLVPASLLNRLLKEAHDIDLAQAAQSPLTTTLAQQAAQLTMYASHFHQVFDFGVSRGDFLPGDRAFYGRPVNADSIPDLSTYDLLNEAALAIVQGENDRQSQHPGPAMALPSAAEVQARQYAFQIQRNLALAAETHTDTQREEAQLLYPQAQALAVDICDTVEFFYRHDPDDGSRRTKCERWGVVYIFEPTPGTPTPPPVPPTP